MVGGGARGRHGGGGLHALRVKAHPLCRSAGQCSAGAAPITRATPGLPPPPPTSPHLTWQQLQLLEGLVGADGPHQRLHALLPYVVVRHTQLLQPMAATDELRACVVWCGVAGVWLGGEGSGVVGRVVDHQGGREME